MATITSKDKKNIKGFKISMTVEKIVPAEYLSYYDAEDVKHIPETVDDVVEFLEKNSESFGCDVISLLADIDFFVDLDYWKIDINEEK